MLLIELFQKLINRFAGIGKLGLALLLVLISVGSYAGWHHGYVFTRGMVLTDSGNPIWATYDESGQVVSELGEAAGNLNPTDWWVFSGERHRTLEDEYAQLEAKYPGLAVISKSDFESQSFTTVDGRDIPKPSLVGSTAYVAILPQQYRILPIPEQLVLAQYPINPTQSVGDSIVSMLVNEAGDTKLHSDYRIGFKVNMLGDKESTNYWRDYEDDIHGPVPGVIVDGFLGNKGITNEEGAYGISWFSIPCPMYYYSIDGFATAELWSRRFNPGAKGPLTYFVMKPFSETCRPNIIYVPFIGAWPLGLGTPETFPYKLDFPLDVMVLSGVGFVAGAPVTGQTEYTTNDIDLSWFPQQSQDIDGDSVPDTIDIGRFESNGDEQAFVVAQPSNGSFAGLLQGIYLSSSGKVPGQDNPDFTVTVQQDANFSNEGMLSGISLEDLRNTDLYVFREADDKLISERIGLSEPELSYADVGVNDEYGAFFYRLEMRGELGDIFRFHQGGYRFRNEFDDWQAASGINPDLHNLESDHLRAGDRVRIVAINRATGYIGSVRTTMQQAGTEAYGDLSWEIDPILMYPPNLKIWVERDYTVEHGLSSINGDRNEQVIGYEGAGLTSDEKIAIYTEWTDIDGTPLPKTLEDAGFTGRIASLSGNRSLPGGNSGIYNFDIKPGKQLQVLKLPQGSLDSQHFYVQVSGEPSHGNPVFSNNNRVGGPDFSSGNHSGQLQGRPNRFVPFMVPILNEPISREQLRIYYEQLAQNPGANIVPPKPYYEWRYRPEMQFSLYDLDVEALKLETAYDEETGVSSTDLDILYDLNTTAYDPLESFQGERELIYSVGISEQFANVNDGSTTTTFENIELLTQANNNQLLAVQMTARHDSFNPIYEYVGVPLLMSSSKPMELGRNHTLGAFNADVNNNGVSDVTDTFTIREFYLSQNAKVTVQLLDESKNPVTTLIDDENLGPDIYSFILTYSDVANYVLPRSGTDFYVQIFADVENDPIEHKVIIPGNLTGDISSEMLGHVVEHDVLTQRGSLSIQREDLNLEGRGPDLSFIRSYSNESRRELGNQPMGPGWNHNHNIFVQIVARGGIEPLRQNNLPGWIFDYRESEYKSAFVPKRLLPTSFPVEPKMVNVSNGGTFKYSGGTWHAQRGRHGRLEFVDDHFEYTSKDGTKYIFEPISSLALSGRGHVEYVEDRNGNRLTYEYESAPTSVLQGDNVRIKTITDAVGRSLSFNYTNYPDDYLWRLTNVNCSCGINLEYSYDDFGATNEVSFKENNKVLSAYARSDYTESYGYAFNSITDQLVNLISVTDAIGQVKKYDYLSPVNDKNILDQLRFYAKGLNYHDVVETVTYPDNKFAKFTYEANTTSGLNKRTVTDLRGNDTEYTLNFYGNPNLITKPLGYTEKLVWSIDEGKDDNVITSRTDEFNNTTTYEYDAQGNVTREVDPYSIEIIQEWNPLFSILTRRVDKNGNVFRQALDGKGNVIDDYQSATVDGVTANVHRSHDYNSFGERIFTIDGRNNKTSYGYDQWGLLRSISEPEGSNTTFVNDARGRRLSKTDPRQNTTSYDYDELDRLTKVTDPEGNTTDYDYDAKGNKILEETKDKYLVGGSTHVRTDTLNYEYEDKRDRVTSVTRTGQTSGVANSTIGGSKSYSYDANSNMLTESDWKGVSSIHTYDELNRRKTTQNRANDSMSYNYAFVSGKGLRKTITDYEGRVRIEHYDKLNRLERVQLPAVTHYDGASNNYERSYTYDNMENVLTETDENGHVTSYEYDGRYLRTKRTDALLGNYITEYDANGNLTKTTDEESRVTTFIYDKQNRMTNKQKPENHNWVYAYDNNGNVTSITDPWNYVISTTYDKVNQPKTITNPDGLETVGFTVDGQKVYHSDSEGRSTTRFMGPDNRLVQEVDDVGRTTTYSYDNNGNVTDSVISYSNAATGPGSVATHFEYDSLDRLTNQFDAYATAVQREIINVYDKVGNLKRQTFPDGRVTNFDYDAFNRQITITDALGRLSHSKYDGVGNLVKVVDRRGNTTSTTYDRLNRIDIITDELNQTIDRDYDKVGNMRFETDKRGTQTEHVYDGLNRLVSTHKPKTTGGLPIRLVFNEYDIGGAKQDRITDTNNNSIVQTYNWRGQVLQTDYPAGQGYTASNSSSSYDGSGYKLTDTDENNYLTSYTYYDDGRLHTVTDANNDITTYDYDLFGNQARMTRPKSNATTFTYDALNRLSVISDAQLYETRYQYDVNDNLRHQYTPNPGTGADAHVEYVYDVLNRKKQHIQHKSTGNLTTNFDYDNAGNLIYIQDPKGQVFHRDYDGLNRLKEQRYPTGSDINRIVTTYDANNNIDVVTEYKPSATEITDHGYDALDRLTSVVQRGHSISYSYDDNGNRTGVTSNQGNTTYTFDARNRLATAVVGADTTTYQYQANGWKTGVSYPNGTSTSYTFDNVGRTDVVTHTAADASVISSFDYDYDTNGNRTRQLEIQNGFSDSRQQVTDYVYDTLDRMESYTISDTDTGNTTETVYTFHPSYDRATEVVTETVAATPTIIKNRSYSYDQAHWLKEITDQDTGNTIAYVYDDNGNTLSKVDNTQATPEYTSFRYNSRDQLIETIRGPPASEVSLGTHAYNFKGMRIRHLNSERGDIEYIYDDRSILEEVQNGTSSLVAYYRYADRLISLTTTTDTQYYHFAALGTTANLSTPAGTVQTSYRLDPYGKITRQEGRSVNRQVFTGQEHDEKTGLIYFGARFYDPDTARFITQDSYLGERGTPPSLHRYLYAYSNPTVYIDLFGYASEEERRAAQEWVRKQQEEAKRLNQEWNKAADQLNEMQEEGISEGRYMSRDEAKKLEDKRKQDKEKEAYLTEEKVEKRISAEDQIREDYNRDFRSRELKAVEKAKEIGDTLAETSCTLSVACRGYETITGNRAASTTGEKLSPTERFNPIKSPIKKQNKGLLHTDLAKKSRAYIDDVEKITGRKLHPKQRKLLMNDLRKNKYRRLDKDAVEANRIDFDRKRPKLIKDWEKNTGKKWPVEKYKDKKTGQWKQRKYDAHHIVENKYGGKAEWWNITPAKRGVEHQSGIHRPGGPAEQLFGR